MSHLWGRVRNIGFASCKLQKCHTFLSRNSHFHFLFQDSWSYDSVPSCMHYISDMWRSHLSELSPLSLTENRVKDGVGGQSDSQVPKQTVRQLDTLFGFSPSESYYTCLFVCVCVCVCVCVLCQMVKWEPLRFAQRWVTALQVVCLPIHNASLPLLQEQTLPRAVHKKSARQTDMSTLTSRPWNITQHALKKTTFKLLNPLNSKYRIRVLEGTYKDMFFFFSFHLSPVCMFPHFSFIQ